MPMYSKAIERDKQVIAFQKACLTKQYYSMEVCMYQLGFLIRNEF